MTTPRTCISCVYVADGRRHELEIHKDDGMPIRVGAYEIKPTQIEVY